MTISRVTKEQYKKVLKAVLYSFASTFIATLLANPSLDQLNERTVVAAGVAGVNAVLVYIKQLFTEAQ